ncbi:MAG: DUF58 domain-containing protein [Candidatus Omnitrophica bacterium]|nr:DUF58 domain-containing protein [Candidatus Omnitrophota bacterium]
MPKKKYSFLTKAEDHFFIKKAVIYARMWFTDIGKILCGIIFLGIMVSSPGLQISAYLMPIFIMTIFSSAFIFAFFSRPKVSLKRILSPSPCAGEYLVYQVILKNLGKRPIRDLKICEDVLPFGLYDAPDHKDYRGTVDWLEPEETLTLKLIIRCKYRGIYDLPNLLVGTSFPSGLLRWPLRTGQKDRLIVYPKFISQTDFVVPFKRVYQPGGIAISSNIGDSNEFLTTREYRRGDRLKDIHWASFARTGQLIVKEFVDEYFIRIGLLLDTALEKRQKNELFETRISIAAGIADAIAKKDYIIDLFAAGDILHHFQMGRALAHLENLLEILACIEPVSSVNLNKLEINLMPYIKKLSSMIILLSDWDSKRAELCRTIELLGTSIRVLIIRDRPLSMQPDREITIINTSDDEGLIR